MEGDISCLYRYISWAGWEGGMQSYFYFIHLLQDGRMQSYSFKYIFFRMRLLATALFSRTNA
jgi:hypothetical protein